MTASEPGAVVAARAGVVDTGVVETGVVSGRVVVGADVELVVVCGAEPNQVCLPLLCRPAAASHRCVVRLCNELYGWRR